MTFPEQHIDLINNIAKKYFSHNIPHEYTLEDMVQEATRKMLKNPFDKTRSNETTYIYMVLASVFSSFKSNNFYYLPYYDNNHSHPALSNDQDEVILSLLLEQPDEKQELYRLILEQYTYVDIMRLNQWTRHEYHQAKAEIYELLLNRISENSSI